jgi:uncharacterized membrane protein YidH (DUF202 family)
MNHWLRTALTILLLGLVAQPLPLRACTACFGQSDSPMAEGMNWGILSLLVVVVGVLTGIASFFVFIAKRSANDKAQ